MADSRKDRIVLVVLAAALTVNAGAIGWGINRIVDHENRIGILENGKADRTEILSPERRQSITTIENAVGQMNRELGALNAKVDFILERLPK